MSSKESTTSTNPIHKSTPAETTSSGTSRITTDGSIVQSDDPTTRSDASITQKLKGDVSGAVKGTVGSMQAATGATIRSQNLESKGLDKMQEEDKRLGAKRGVMPVGTGQRETKTNSSGATG